MKKIILIFIISITLISCKKNDMSIATIDIYMYCNSINIQNQTNLVKEGNMTFNGHCHYTFELDKSKDIICKIDYSKLYYETIITVDGIEKYYKNYEIEKRGQVITLVNKDFGY